jgi:hypothetical protein
MIPSPLDEAEPTYDDTFTFYPVPLSPRQLEEAIVFERLHLYNHLQPCGAPALQRHLRELGVEPLPSVSTIGRILSRNFLTHGRTGYYPEDYR